MKVPSFVAQYLEKYYDPNEYLAYEFMQECVSGIKLSNNTLHMVEKKRLQNWLREDEEHLILLSKAIVNGYENIDKVGE